jgi:hypothetical protein
VAPSLGVGRGLTTPHSETSFLHFTQVDGLRFFGAMQEQNTGRVVKHSRKKFIHFLVANLKERDHSEDLDVNRRTLLQWILQK